MRSLRCHPWPSIHPLPLTPLKSVPAFLPSFLHPRHVASRHPSLARFRRRRSSVRARRLRKCILLPQLVYVGMIHHQKRDYCTLHSARRNNADALERKKGGTRKRSDRWRGQKTVRKWGGREGKGKAARGRLSGGRKDYGSGDRCLVATTQYHSLLLFWY